MSISTTRHVLHGGILLALLAVALYLPFQVFGVIPFTRAYSVSDAEMQTLFDRGTS